MKKNLSIILCTAIVFTSFPMNTQASGVTDAVVSDAAVIKEQTGKVSGPASEALKKITSIVKGKLTIPKALTNFDYQYNTRDNYSTPAWELIWSNSKGTEKISVMCDEEGNIIHYYHSKDSDSSQNKPRYLKSELQKKAEEFIRKTAPSVSKKIKLTDSNQVDTYSGQYSYNYIRMEGSIPMPDNGVSISLNYETGEVTSCSVNWLYDVTIPTSTPVVSKKEAAEKINDKIKMELSYKSNYTTDKSGKTTVKAFLVYEPDKEYIAVDAKNGKVYLTQNEYTYGQNSAVTGEAKKEAASDKAAGDSLTDKEIESINKLNNLISRESAIDKVKKEDSLLIDANATKITADLTQYYSLDGGKSFVWNVDFSDSRESKDETYRAYASASVDAVTGQILSFYGSVPDYYDIGKDKWDEVKINYTKEQGQTVLENFLKKQIPFYYNKSKLSDTDHDYIIAYKEQNPVYGGYRYNYDRFNEGVAFSSNGISGSVDGVTGKIYRYHFNWDENVKFESAKDVMTKEEAFTHYIEKEGYNLIYEINAIHSLDKKSAETPPTYQVRLVYRTDIYPAAISPFTGKQLDYNGEEYVKETGFSYTDIDSYKGKNAILILADMGVGFKGNKFLPDKKITAKEFTSLLSELGYDTEGLKLKAADKTITRTNGVKALIKLAKLDKAAQIKGIYKTDFKDQNQIPKDDLGYIALGKGLGIVTGSTFRPKDSLTRGEAAQIIVNFLKM